MLYYVSINLSTYKNMHTFKLLLFNIYITKVIRINYKYIKKITTPL